MNKKTLVLAACLAMVVASSAMAQSVIWMDARPNNAASGVNTITGTLGAVNPYVPDNVNGGRKGAGQVVRIEPKHGDGWETANPTSFPNHDGDGNRSTADIWIYMDVNDDLSGTGDVISSLSLDAQVTKLGTLVRNTIASTTLSIINDNTVFNSIVPAGGNPWNNKIDGTPSGLNVNGAKAVRVPVEAGPMYNAALGIQPRASGLTDIPYRVAKMTVVSGTRNCTFPNNLANSTYEIRLKANNLLTTRVYNGAGDADEQINYGYDVAGAPEGPAISGNDTVSVSAIADCVVEVRMKGDYSGDGRVTTADTGTSAPPVNYLGAVFDASDNLVQSYCGDFSGDNRVTTADTGTNPGTGYLDTLFVKSPSCP
jgi:hypothetical protein